MAVEDFTTWLQRQLRRREWKQADLVRKGFAASTVSSWVRGTRVPDAELADRLADVLGVDRDIIFSLVGIRPEEPVDPDHVRNIISKVRRVRWNAERQRTIDQMLETMLAFDRGEAPPLK